MQKPTKLQNIYGGKFEEPWTVEKLQIEIDRLPNRNEKPTILFVGEASFLRTGFSTYWYNVLNRLYKTNKINIVEMGCYARSSDPRAKSLPWKFIGVIPEESDKRTMEFYHQNYREAQFGRFIMEDVLAAVRPDAVVCLTDHWMAYFWNNSIFRDKFHWIYMACVDSQPQGWDWLKTYEGADTLLAYSHFGKRVMEEQSKTDIAASLGIKPLDVKMVCQPGIDVNIYQPKNKAQIKAQFGIPTQFQFIGMVSRNQKRKLFSRLIESFRTFKDNNGWLEEKKRLANIDNIKLLLHTCVQDVGFNIPETIRRQGLLSEVFFTYVCTSCGVFGVSPFIGHPAECPACKKRTFITPNTQIGLPDEAFTNVFNLMDVYVQMSVAGASEMCLLNAKSVGVPIVTTDYAAMYEQARNGGGIGIKCDLETEAETMQLRAFFDRQDLVDKLTKLFRKSGTLEQLGREARRCAVEYYDWDLTAKKWEYIFDSIELKPRSETWDKPIQTINLPSELLHKMELSDEEFVDVCYTKLLNRQPDDDGRNHWLQTLKGGHPREQVEKYFRNITETKNHAASLLGQGDTQIMMSPIEKIANGMNKDDKFRILYCIPETAGDVLISTGILAALQEKYPTASIYVATNKKYFDILKNNPYVKGVFEYCNELDNYRSSEPFGPSRGFVDLCFCPHLVTQRIPHWIHGGMGESLGVTYGHLCNLNLTNEYLQKQMFIDTEGVDDLPAKYITFHSKTTQDPKNYDYWDEVFERIAGIPIVQVGEKNEPLLNHKDVVDFRGKTTPQQLAYIIKNSILHIGLDSFPAHVANVVGAHSVLVYGGTYPKQGGICRSIAVEPENRNGCITSCHLSECIAKKQGGNKCINNILPDDIVKAISKYLNKKYILPEKQLKLSAYCIIRDGIKYKFPYQQCIKAALKVCDEFVMVDGGSTDGTFEDLQKLSKAESRLRVLQHTWDFNSPMMMGEEKTYAKQQCNGDYTIHLDADEIIVENHPGQIRKLLKSNKNVHIFDFPVINLYGDKETVRFDDACVKWRIFKNIPEIIHTAHGAARIFDAEKMCVTFNKKVSDGCEMCHKDTLEIYPHSSILPPVAHQVHEQIRKLYLNQQEIPSNLIEQYKNILEQIVDKMPFVIHCSWLDLETKTDRGEMWEQTWHGRNTWSHGTRQDVTERINQNKELTFKATEKIINVVSRFV